jgi:hypothetical protein
MQRYAHYNPTCGTILCITESDSMDYITPITEEQYQAYRQASETWRVDLETMELYQVEPVPVEENPTPAISTDERVSALEANDATQDETIGIILEDILPGLE